MKSSKKMQALIFKNNTLSYVANHQRPSPARGEALIKVQLAGICSTDLEIIKGYMGFEGILGHEFVGVVEECEDNSWLGTRVVGSINAACRNCIICHSQGPEHCPERTVLGIFNRDGAFAEYLVLPKENLLEVPEKVSNEQAVFVEPLAAALRILEQVSVKPTARTAVVGPGRLGLLTGQILSLNGTDVTMIGRSDSSLKTAERIGLKGILSQDAGADSFDFVVEATGNQDGFATSLRIIRPGGTIILKSTFAKNASLDLTKIVVSEITVIGSRCGPFAPALRLLEKGAVNLSHLIDGRYEIQKGLDAFKHAAIPGTKKILLTPS